MSLSRASSVVRIREGRIKGRVVAPKDSADAELKESDALNEQAFIEECQLIIAKGAFPASAGSQPADARVLLKRSGQMTLSLGGSMRLVPASRSPLAVPAATGQPDAEG